MAMPLPEVAASPGVDDAFGHWLAGFIDGEGCFFFHKHKLQFSPPQFQLKLRDDDRAVLEECAVRTGLGRVLPIPRKDRSKPQCKWIIAKKADCLSLVALLDRYPLRAKKQHDFAIWREAVLHWAAQKRIGTSGGGTEKFDGQRGDALRERLTKGRQYAPVHCA